MGTTVQNPNPSGKEPKDVTAAKNPPVNPILPQEPVVDSTGSTLAGDVNLEAGGISGAGYYYQGNLGGSYTTDSGSVSASTTYQGISGDIATIGSLNPISPFPQQGLLQTANHSFTQVNGEIKVRENTSIIGGVGYLTGDLALSNLIQDGTTGATGNMPDNAGLYGYAGVKQQINPNWSVSGGAIYHNGAPENVFCDPKLTGRKFGVFAQTEYNGQSLDGKTAISAGAGGAIFQNGTWYGQGKVSVGRQITDSGAALGASVQGYVQGGEFNGFNRQSVDAQVRINGAPNENGNYNFAKLGAKFEHTEVKEYYDAKTTVFSAFAGRHFELQSGNKLEVGVFGNAIDIKSKELPLANCDCAPLIMPTGGSAYQAGVAAKYTFWQDRASLIAGVGMNHDRTTSQNSAMGFAALSLHGSNKAMAEASHQSTIVSNVNTSKQFAYQYVTGTSNMSAEQAVQLMSSDRNNVIEGRKAAAVALSEMQASGSYNNNPRFQRLVTEFAEHNHDLVGGSSKYATARASTFRNGDTVKLTPAHQDALSRSVNSSADFTKLNGLGNYGVAALQTTLIAHGVYRGQPDGIAGANSNTQKGLNQLINQGVDVNAEVRRVAQETINNGGSLVVGSSIGKGATTQVAHSTSRTTNSGINYSDLASLDRDGVKAVQTALKSEGLYHGTIDGYAFMKDRSVESGTQKGLAELAAKGKDINIVVASISGTSNNVGTPAVANGRTIDLNATTTQTVVGGGTSSFTTNINTTTTTTTTNLNNLTPAQKVIKDMEDKGDITNTTQTVGIKKGNPPQTTTTPDPTPSSKSTPPKTPNTPKTPTPVDPTGDNASVTPVDPTLDANSKSVDPLVRAMAQYKASLQGKSDAVVSPTSLAVTQDPAKEKGNGVA